MEAYERSEHERQLLRIIARGEQEIAAGKGFDLDVVLAEADALLPVAQGEASVHALRTHPISYGVVLYRSG